jgi:hypothetical protein
LADECCLSLRGSDVIVAARFQRADLCAHSGTLKTNANTSVVEFYTQPQSGSSDMR